MGIVNVFFLILIRVRLLIFVLYLSRRRNVLYFKVVMKFDNVFGGDDVFLFLRIIEVVILINCCYGVFW